jgi:hypothetical protein|tara:strand:+ start:2981 stop:3715 length:735 start_codon:yes stop_codon:yes gene_type:complete
VVVVVIATIAALPLFVFEDASSPASFTGTAGASDAPEVQSVELVVAAAPRFEPDVAGLSDRAQVWHLARSKRDTSARLAEVARHYEADALAAARLVAADEFADQARLEVLLTAQQAEIDRQAERVRLRTAELERREEAMSTPGPTTTIPWDTTPHADGPSDIQWEALRFCEATGHYGAVNPTGKYRGAYQFSRETWDWIAGLDYEHLVGVDPAAAAPGDQDRMAQALYDLRGRGQWPVCGRYLP